VGEFSLNQQIMSVRRVVAEWKDVGFPAGDGHGTEKDRGIYGNTCDSTHGRENHICSG
jgi:hypothetical protein